MTVSFGVQMRRSWIRPSLILSAVASAPSGLRSHIQRRGLSGLGLLMGYGSQSGRRTCVPFGWGRRGGCLPSQLPQPEPVVWLSSASARSRAPTRPTPDRARRRRWLPRWARRPPRGSYRGCRARGRVVRARPRRSRRRSRGGLSRSRWPPRRPAPGKRKRKVGGGGGRGGVAPGGRNRRKACR